MGRGREIQQVATRGAAALALVLALVGDPGIGKIIDITHFTGLGREALDCFFIDSTKEIGQLPQERRLACLGVPKDYERVIFL